ncbi:hypothetical protein [Pseudohaliea sp.]|uniref:hypothetical protein n=1 Tax=Pseudohaliea sp. TaxID=2740289 RepID=UPI0032F09685
MSEIKTGMRLKSAVSDVEVMVVKCEGVSSLTCGDVPMVPNTEAAPSDAGDYAGDEVCQLGKRYISPQGSIEVVCVKGGKGGLAADGEPLEVKAPTALPSSD